MALGQGLDRVVPLWLDIGPAASYAGWLLNALATVLLLWCFALFIRHRTTILPRHPVTTLVAVGPYRLSRNPMYLSLGLFHLGIALSTGNGWHFLSLLPDLLAIRYWVIAPEEAYMQARFGREFTAYSQLVRRWL